MLTANRITRGWRTHDGAAKRRRQAGGSPSEPPRIKRPPGVIVDDLVAQLAAARRISIGPIMPAGDAELPWRFTIRAREAGGPFELQVNGHSREATVELRNKLILRIARPPRTLH